MRNIVKTSFIPIDDQTAKDIVKILDVKCMIYDIICTTWFWKYLKFKWMHISLTWVIVFSVFRFCFSRIAGSADKVQTGKFPHLSYVD